MFTGNNVLVADFDEGILTWDSDDGPTMGLLGRADLAHPTIVTAGIYAVTTRVAPSAAMTVNGYFTVILFMDTAGVNARWQIDSSLADAADNALPTASVTGVFYMPAGAIFYVAVDNFDKVAARSFGLKTGTSVQRVT